MVASNLDKRKKFIKKAIDYGHEIGCHGYHHYLFTKLKRDGKIKQIKKACSKFKKYKIKVLGFRPPFLEHDTELLELLPKFGFEYISSKREPSNLSIPNVNIIYPDDWLGKKVHGFNDSKIISFWKNTKKGTILLHPHITPPKLIKYFTKKNRDYTIKRNLNGKSISIDIY